MNPTNNSDSTNIPIGVVKNPQQRKNYIEWRSIVLHILWIISACVLPYYLYLTRTTVQRPCDTYKFQCVRSGECIPFYQLCDGKRDCMDSTDETAQACEGKNCTIDNNNFRCTYGACMPASSKCNGVPDCVDNSDEENCSESFKNINNMTNVCDGGAILRYDVISTCSRNGQTIPCDHQLQHNTIANLTCAFGYKRPDGTAIETISCQDGEWIPQPSKCEQLCGLNAANDAITLIVGGNKSNISEDPWMINIRYRNHGDDDFKQICAGTIINAKQFVTAAHCLYNESDHKLIDTSHFEVGAGSNLRNYAGDSKVQIHYIAHIDFPSEYRGEDGYIEHDFAVVTIKRYFKFNKRVRPVCIASNLTYAQKHIKANTIGRTAGWGHDAYDNGVSSPELKSVNLTTIDIFKCIGSVSQEFSAYFNTGFRICLENSHDIGLWSGDSGGGFTIESEYNGTLRRTLVGIISLSSPIRKNYRDNEFTLLTNVQFYKEIIDMSQHRLQDSS